jgi:hypothetical protein
VDTTPAVETAATTTIKPVSSQVTSADKKRKRELPDHSDGEEWARKVTKIPPNVMSVFRQAEELLSENIELKSEYFADLMQEAKTGGPPPYPNPQDDIQVGPPRFRPGLLHMFWNVWKEHETNIFNFGLKKDEVLNAPVVDTSETLL